MIWWVGGSLGRVRCGRWEEGVKKKILLSVVLCWFSVEEDAMG